MPIISSIQLTQQSDQFVLSVRESINFSSFPEFANKAFTEIERYVQRENILFSGYPFVCYHNADLENLDVEIGFPVAHLLSGEGKIVGKVLVSEKIVSGIFLGPYEESDILMNEINKWIIENGYKSKGKVFNYYLNDTQRPPSEFLLKIAIPVE